nr:MAG: RNA-dependent RNA polymerase [Riboviria sp.]
MDTAHGELKERNEQASNVVLGITEQESVGQAAAHVTPSWYLLSSSEQHPEYSNLTDRFTFWKSLQWTTDQVRDTELAYDKLPYQFIADAPGNRPCNVPMFIPFQIHRYYRSDLEIKIQVNSNKFQIGQLQCSWMYLDELLIDKRPGIFLCSQKPHCIVNAGSSNEAVLNIPYKHIRPYLHTSFKSEFINPLVLGNLRILVLSPLTRGTAGPPACTVSIFIRFINAKFTGMVDGALTHLTVVEPQMEGLMSAISLVDKLVGDKNCDNPPRDNIPHRLIPTAASSWSYGTGISEPVNPLRLQGHRMGVARNQEIGYNEMLMRVPLSTFGMLRHITWSSVSQDNNVTGTLLWSCDANPMLEKAVFDGYTPSDKDSLMVYAVPPVTVVSSMFDFWRGGLEFRFDIVASQFHTGRLLIAYIPGVAGGEHVSLQEARNSAHIVFSLQETQSVTFTVPYIADKPWWQRRYGGAIRASETRSPSRVFMFILNPLIPMESVANAVFIIPYVRASVDFELAVPVQPALGLSLDPRFISNTANLLRVKTGYEPAYAGAWRYFFNSGKYILRYGNVTEHIAQFVLPNIPLGNGEYIVWQLEPFESAWVFTVEPRVRHTIYYLVIWTYEGFHYAIPYWQEQLREARIVARNITVFNDINSVQSYIPNFVEDGPYSTIKIVARPLIYSEAPPVTDDFELVEPEMEERHNAPNGMQPTNYLPTTSAGASIFGERFVDLKDLSRRYQLYWEGQVSATFTNTGPRSQALLQFPAIPDGLALDIRSDLPIWNSLREGQIPLIASGYRFFRGGLRFRVVLPLDFQGNFWVQHRPDIPAASSAVQTGTSINTLSRYRNHNYAQYIQSTRINNVIDFEIPFYQPGLYGLLDKHLHSVYALDAVNYLSLGMVVLGVENHNISSVNYNISIYYSLADDMSFNVFQGFPRMVFCDETYEYVERRRRVQPQMMSYISGALGQLTASATTKLVTTRVDDVKQHLRAELKKEVSSIVVPHVKRVVTTIDEAKGSLEDKLKDWVQSVGLTTCMSQFIHILNHPTPKTVAIAIGSMVGIFLQVTVEVLAGLHEVLAKFVSSIWHILKGEPSQPQAGPTRVDPEMEEVDLESSRVYALLFTMISGIIGISVKAKSYGSFILGVSATAGLANNCLTLLKNFNGVIVNILKYVIAHLDDTSRIDYLLEKEEPELKEWIKEVVYLTDPRNRPRILRSKKEANRVYDACTYGGIILMNNLHKSFPGAKTVADFHKKVVDLRDELVSLGKHPDVRFECFSIWMSGPPGIGKSFMTSEVTKDLLKSVNCKTDEQMIAWLNPSSKYWNNVRNQPCLARDDAYAVNGPRLEDEVAAHFMICSSCVLNPPMARVEDKNLCINPLIYYMNANSTFPDISGQVAHKSAIYRRRKACIEVEFTPEIIARYNENLGDDQILDASVLTAAEVENYSHLRFRYVNNPKDPNNPQRGLWMTYVQMLDILRDKFKKHYIQEQINFKQRVLDNYCLSGYFDYNDLQSIPELTIKQSVKEALDRRKAVLEEERMAAEYMSEVDGKPWLSEKILGILKSWQNMLEPEQDDAEELDMDTYTYQRHFDLSAFTPEQLISDLCNRVGLHKPFLLTILHKYDVITDELWRDCLSFMLSAIDISAQDGVPDRMMKIILPHGEAYVPQEIRIFPFDNWAELWTSFLSLAIDSNPELPSWQMIHPTVNLEATYERDSAIGFAHYVAGWLRVRSTRAIFELYKEFKEDLAVGPLWKRRAAECWVDGKIDRLNFINLRTILSKFGYMKRMCPHISFWIENLANPNITYCRFKDRFFGTNMINMSTSVSRVCDCEHGIDNIFVLTALQRITMETAGIDIDMSHNACREVEQLTAWGPWLHEQVSCWWDHYLSPALHSILRVYLKYWPYIWLALHGMFKVYDYFKSPVEELSCEDVEPEGSNVYAFDKPRHPRAKISRSDKMFREARAAEPQSIDQRNVIRRKIENNSFFIVASYIADGERRTLRGRCLFIRNHTYLFIRHYFEQFRALLPLNPSFEIHFNQSGRASFQTITFDALFKDIKFCGSPSGRGESNYCLAEMPNYIPQFKNIVHLIATEGQHNKIGRLVDIYSIGAETMFDLELKRDGKFLVSETADSSEVAMERAYTYQAQGKGMCGSMVVANNINDGNGAIIGMHVAGDSRSGRGVCEPIYREMFELYTSRLVPSVEYRMPDFKDIELDKLNSNMLIYGEVEAQFAHHESGKSKIVPSPIAGACYPVITEVNPLKPNDPRQPPGSDPLYDGCNKHGTGTVLPFPTEDVAIVKESCLMLLKSKVLPVRPVIEPLTMEQAICGDTDLPFFEPLNWKSSEGFPLSSKRPKGAHDKKWLFDLEESTFGYKLKGVNSVLIDVMNMREIMYKNDVYMPSIYIDCLKDYRLPPEKCAIPGKTRIFSISPIQLTIDFRRYCTDFTAAYKQACIVSEHGIGINPDSMQWTELAHYLSEVGENIVTADYSAFGYNLSSQVVAGVCDNICEWYKYNGASEDHIKRLRLILEYDIMNPVHLCGRTVYRTFNGIASGSAMTAELNSEVNKMFIRLIYLDLARRHSYRLATMTSFNEHVRLVTYGDDVIMSVSDEIKEWFNCVTMGQAFAKFGITFTNGYKDDRLIYYEKLVDSSFLKRGFKPHPKIQGVLLAPVARTSVEECVNWIHVSNDDHEALLEVCRASMDLAFGHGPEYYKEHGDKLMRACRTINLSFSFKSWDERNREIFDLDIGNIMGLRCVMPWYYYSEEEKTIMSK